MSRESKPGARRPRSFGGWAPRPDETASHHQPREILGETEGETRSAQRPREDKHPPRNFLTIYTRKGRLVVASVQSAPGEDPGDGDKAEAYCRRQTREQESP